MLKRTLITIQMVLWSFTARADCNGYYDNSPASIASVQKAIHLSSERLTSGIQVRLNNPRTGCHEDSWRILKDISERLGGDLSEATVYYLTNFDAFARAGLWKVHVVVEYRGEILDPEFHRAADRIVEGIPIGDYFSLSSWTEVSKIRIIPGKEYYAEFHSRSFEDYETRLLDRDTSIFTHSEYPTFNLEDLFHELRRTHDPEVFQIDHPQQPFF